MSNDASSPEAAEQDAWPALPYDEWKATRDTLHMCTQVVGKVRLALAPAEPQWGHVPLYVTARGLTTSPMPLPDRTFEIDLDLVSHEVEIVVSDGTRRAFGLRPRPVARFYEKMMDALGSLGIAPKINERPSEVPNAMRFSDDYVHDSYDFEHAHRFFRVLSRIDSVMKEHRARFRGRASPVAFFWGSFDLSYARFSGRPAQPPPGSDVIYRGAMDAEQIEFGFWPGDDRFREAAFFSYTYPKPRGIEQATIRPPAAFWSDSLGEMLLRYDDVRRAPSPRDAVLDFFESAYGAGASTAGWDSAPEGVSRAA
jgi:hypothetical protein